MRYDVAVIGGGAAGLACAVRLSEKNNLKIAVIDAADRLGRKLAQTGNGQGNISNADLSIEHYYGGGRELAGRIACTVPYIYKSLFDCLFTEDCNGRIFPAGKQASALTDCLLRKLKDRADIFYLSKVTQMDKGFNIILSDGQAINSDYAVLCVGGKAQRQFKTDGSSYALAENFGHKITPLYPSLVQLKTKTDYIKGLKGIRTECKVSAIYKGNILKTVCGDVIFTEYGVTGNAIFSVSAAIADKSDCIISLEFLPDISKEDIILNIRKRKQSGCKQTELLSGTCHNQLGRSIISRCGSGDEVKIADLLKNFTLEVTGTLGFDYAQVTKGGIDVKGVTVDLESKYIKNLFFAGEVLDVDGDCGGYNLQWAFASGVYVADNILNRL